MKWAVSYNLCVGVLDIKTKHYISNAKEKIEL